jgi:CRP-like cAMP-binding protein
MSNLLLAALPRSQYRALLPRLTSVSLEFGDVLHEQGKPIREVFFPTASMVSLLTLVDGHLALEVGMVGREGMVGMAFALGSANSPVRGLVQGAGPALRMDARRFGEALAASTALQRALQHYTGTLIRQISQTAGCNRFHVVEQRLARWLLMTRDRVRSAEFHLTHDFLSQMLGVRRVGVTEAASALQRRKLIEYRRGRIRICDQPGLQAAACACYLPVR